MLKVFINVLAIITIMLGVILFVLPIPVGLVVIGIGLTMLIANSTLVRKAVRNYRGQYAALDKMMSKLEGLVPANMRKLLKKTKPKK